MGIFKFIRQNQIVFQSRMRNNPARNIWKLDFFQHLILSELRFINQMSVNISLWWWFTFSLLLKSSSCLWNTGISSSWNAHVLLPTFLSLFNYWFVGFFTYWFTLFQYCVFANMSSQLWLVFCFCFLIWRSSFLSGQI